MKEIINNIEIDYDVDYYAILGVDHNASKVQIQKKGLDLLSMISTTNEVNGVEMSSKEMLDSKMKIIDAMNVLSNDEARAAYDSKVLDNLDEEPIEDKPIDVEPIEEDNETTEEELIEEDEETTEEESIEEEEPIKVVNIINDNKIVKNAKEKLSNIDTKSIALIILTGALTIAGINAAMQASRLHKEAEKFKDNSNIESQDDVIENEEVEEEANIVDTTEDVIDDNEEYEIEYDINSDEYILETTENIYNEIQNLDNKDIAVEFDKDTIESIVRYVRHNDENYTGYNVLSNEYAYELLSELYDANLDISMFFNGLDAYNNINELYTATKNITQESNSYDDEFNAYVKMSEAVDNMNENNYAEVIAIRAIVDETTLIPSMQIARGGALENGNEGEEYAAEKEKARENADSCKAIYDKVSIENQNGVLTQATYKAIEEDETNGLSR